MEIRLQLRNITTSLEIRGRYFGLSQPYVSFSKGIGGGRAGKSSAQGSAFTVLQAHNNLTPSDNRFTFIFSLGHEWSVSGKTSIDTSAFISQVLIPFTPDLRLETSFHPSVTRVTTHCERISTSQNVQCRAWRSEGYSMTNDTVSESA